MQQQDDLNLELEDIIREFSDKPAPAEPAGDTKPLPVEEITAQLEDTKTLPAPEIAAGPEGDTTVLPTAEIVAQLENAKPIPTTEGDTKALPVEEVAAKLEGDTIVVPVEEIRASLEEEKPMVIPFRTPFQQMRRKIVEGPERQYYALREKGVAKLQLLLMLSLLVAVVSVGLTALHGAGFIGENRLRLVIFSQVLLMLLSALMGAFQMIDGLLAIGHLRFTPNTLLACTFIACCVDGVNCLFGLRVPCSAVFCLQVFMSLWGEYLRRMTQTDRMDTMRRAHELSAISATEDYFQGAKGLLRSEGDVDDFTDRQDEESTPEKVLRYYSLGVFLAAVAVGVAAGILHGTQLGIQAGTMAVLAGMPGTIFITLEKPRQLLEKRLHQQGSVLCGWKGVKALRGRAVFPVTFRDLFPEGTVKLNGVKFYGNLEPKTVIGYAAAVAAREGGSLAPIMEQLRDSHNAPNCETDNYKTYTGGIGGGVEGVVVLVGTLPFLRSLDIQIPEDVRMPGALGISVDGEFSCLLAVNYTRKNSVAAGLAVLTGYHGLAPVLVSQDLMLSGKFLQHKFGVNPKKFCRPEPEERERLRAVDRAEGEQALALITKPGLCAYGYTVVGARALHTASWLGVGVHLLGGILGVGTMLVLGILGTTALLTPWNLLLYQLLWMLPGYLLCQWTRAI